MLSDINRKFVYQQSYSGSTKNSIINVILGKADAGVTLTPVYDMEPEETKRKLRILLKTGVISSHPISSHPRVPVSARKAFTGAVLSLSKSAEGVELLKKVRIPSPVKADFNRDYRPLKKVEIRKLSQWGR